MSEELLKRIEALEERVKKLEEAKPKRTQPTDAPTVEQVIAYGNTLQPPLPTYEAQHFVDHFSANGWKVGGKTKMVDWQASVRNWHRNWITYKQKRFTRTQEPPDDQSEFWVPKS